jgi:hypothetical protein
MGYTRYDSKNYMRYAASTASLSAKDYHAKTPTMDAWVSSGAAAKMEAKQIKMRESRKSDINPLPTPLIVGLDVSGSMGRVVEAMRKGLGTLFEQVIDRHPITDPHVLAMAIGDMECDHAPVQATQFEADPVTIGKQIEDLYLERGGGGNDHESYLGPLYFAAMRTDCDAFKEGRKGFLFTVGDEEPQLVLTKAMIEEFFGDQPKNDIQAAEMVAMIERNWHYFHLMVEEGSYMGSSRASVVRAWSDLIGQHAIPLADHTKMAEVIISLIEVTVGRDKAAVVKSWGKGTDLVVEKAISGLTVPGSTSAPGPVAL